MNPTDDKRPWYGKLDGVHARARKKIYIADKCHLDGEDATMAITIGRMEDREEFVDQLPGVICVEGYQGLEEKFKEWLQERRKKK